MELLRKPLETRSYDDVQILMKLTENMEFFQHMNGKEIHSNNTKLATHAKCCRFMKYRMLPKGTAAIYYGIFIYSRLSR